ncbi:MAG: hypothetical protein N3D75_01015 [Candidatus Aenigmarchaeota archaeon]|nr:hypothetical protein [Candidatus Aenigmarchaeota archaeon]
MKNFKSFGILSLTIIGIVLFSGCVQQEVTCNKPYIKVGTECCIDINDNNICDKDENAQGTTQSNIVCGNKWCQDKEDCMNCPEDCGLCQNLIIEEAKCVRSINPNAPDVLGESCGESCPRFNIQATVYNPNNYDVKIKYGYKGAFVNAYTYKINTEFCAPIFKSPETNLDLCGFYDSITIPAESSKTLPPANLDLLYVGSDIEMSFIQVFYSLNLEEKYQTTDSKQSEPYALKC